MSRILDELLDGDEKLYRLEAVDDAVIVAEGDVHHRPDDDLSVLGDRAFLDLVEPEDADLRWIQDWRAQQ